MKPLAARDLVAELLLVLERVLSLCSGEDLAWDAWARATLERGRGGGGRGLFVRPFAARLLVSAFEALEAIRAELGERDPRYAKAHARAATFRLVFATWMRKTGGAPSPEAVASFDEALAEIAADLEALKAG